MKRVMRCAAGLTMVLGLALVGCDSGGEGTMDAGVPAGVDLTKDVEVAKTGMGMMGPGALKKAKAEEKTDTPAAPANPE